MPHKTHSYLAIALAGACAALLFFSQPVGAQDSQSQSQDSQSVAEAARQARARKAAKTAKVISDDDIDRSSYKPGAQGLNVGSAPTSDSQPPNAAEVKADVKVDEARVTAETTATVKPGEDLAIARAKEELAGASTKLDFLKRANALDQDTYFSKPNYTDDHVGKSKLDAEQAAIHDQQAIVDDLKAKLAELKAEYEKRTGLSADPAPEQEASKPKKAQNAGFSLPDKSAPDQPASDQQPAPQPQS